jgi:small GTP-binding protein
MLMINLNSSLIIANYLPFSCIAQMSADSNPIKLAVMGGGGVGKSAITVKFVQGYFVEKYDPTIENSYRKQVLVDDRPRMVEILDTAGTEQFTAMRDLYIKNTEGIILVFSLLSLSSLQDLDTIKQQIEQIHEDPIPIILCANKCDVVDDIIINSDEYPDISAKYGGPIFETSAKNGTGIEEAFQSIMRNIIENRQARPHAKKKKRRCIIL